MARFLLVQSKVLFPSREAIRGCAHAAGATVELPDELGNYVRADGSAVGGRIG